MAERKHPKNPAAVALGRLGGLKGGKARVRELTAQEIAAMVQRSGSAATTPSERNA